MNHRITNQLHQLSTMGEIKNLTLSANTTMAIFDSIEIPTNATHVQVMTDADALYRSDGINDTCVFPLIAEDITIFTRQDFLKTYISSDTDSTVYVQFLGEQ